MSTSYWFVKVIKENHFFPSANFPTAGKVTIGHDPKRSIGSRIQPD